MKTPNGIPEDDDGYERDIKVEYLPEESTEYDLSFKIIIIGDSGVGKSSLSTQAVKDTFSDFYQTTVGFEFLTFNMKLNNTIIKLQIWDTCGQEVYRSLITNFYRNSSLAVLVYGIDSEESFKNIPTWYTELKRQANPDIKCILVGNKCDLEEKRAISKEEGEKLRNEKNIDLFLEASAKTGFNAKNVLVEAAKILYRDYLEYQRKHGKNAIYGHSVTAKRPQVSLKNINNDTSKSKNCCSK